MPLLLDSDFSSLCRAQNFIHMHDFQEKLIFLQKEDILGKNIEVFSLILIKNQKFGSVRFGRTLGLLICAEPNRTVHKSSAEPNVKFTTSLKCLIF